MKKIILIVWFSIFYILKLVAQPLADSIAFKKAAWESVKIAKGLTWQHFHFNNKQLFNSNQNINVLKVKNKNRKIRKMFVSAGDSLVLTSVLAQQNEALVAVNGSFFDVKQGGAVDFIRIEGQILDTTRLTKGERTGHQKSAMAFTVNQLEILKADSADLKWAGIDSKWDEKLDFSDVMVTGPLLLWQGENAPLSSKGSPMDTGVHSDSKIAFNDNRHPRTCACVTEKKEMILMTVDGRTAESQGVSLPELTRLMKWLNCRDAINLDGGGSTTMYIQGRGVVNMPCDNKKFDHEGERKVSNIVVLKKR